MKSLFATRTFWFNVLSALSVILLLPELQTMLGVNALKIVVLVNAIINIILRYVTTTPVKSLTGGSTITGLVLLLALSSGGCARTPPNLSPAGTAAFKGTQVIKALDALRDGAILLNEQVPPIVSTDTTRKVVTYHKSAITIIHDTPAGWKPTVITGLAELQKSLPANDQTKLAPYFTLAQTLIQEVN